MRTLCTYPSRPRGLARSRQTVTIGGLLVTVCHSGKTRAGSSWLIRSSQNILNCAVNHVGPRRSSPDQWCAWRARCVWARASACARVRRGHARRDRAGLPRSAFTEEGYLRPQVGRFRVCFFLKMEHGVNWNTCSQRSGLHVTLVTISHSCPSAQLRVRQGIRMPDPER
jgi:hypothetical protein